MFLQDYFHENLHINEQTIEIVKHKFGWFTILFLQFFWLRDESWEETNFVIF